MRFIDTLEPLALASATPAIHVTFLTTHPAPPTHITARPYRVDLGGGKSRGVVDFRFTAGAIPSGTVRLGYYVFIRDTSGNLLATLRIGNVTTTSVGGFVKGKQFVVSFETVVRNARPPYNSLDASRPGTVVFVAA